MPTFGQDEKRILSECLRRGLVSSAEITMAMSQAGSAPVIPILIKSGVLSPSDYLDLLRDSELPLEIAGYQVEGELGRGAMGVVYRARRRRDGLPVALKVMLDSLTDNELLLERFNREAQCAAMLRHPNIIGLIEAGLENGLPFMAMEFVAGETLHEASRSMMWEDVVRVMAEVARALHHAHEQGVVHRDLKPANVLITPDGHARVADFGLARQLDRATRLTKTGSMLGTPHYMAPEVASGKAKEADGRADIYSLGVMLYACLTQQLPYPVQNLAQLLRAIEHDTPRSVCELVPGLPPRLGQIVAKAMHKRPDRRFQTGGELASALESLRSPASGRAFLDPTGRVPWRWVGLMGGALLVLALGLIHPWQTDPPVPSAPGPPAAAPPGSAPPPAPPPPIGPPPIRLVTLQPGPAEGKDTYVMNIGLYINDNRGQEELLWVGDRDSQPGDHRAFIEFELSSLPAGQVTHAELWLYLDSTNFHDLPFTLEVHVVAETHDKHGMGAHQTPWLEGTGTNDNILDGMCWAGVHPIENPPETLPEYSYNSKLPRYSQPGVVTDVDFGLGATGLLAEQHLENGRRGWIQLDVTAAVSAWRSGRLPNFGLRLRHREEGPPYAEGAKAFCSSDHPDATRRPKLVLWLQP